jgi:hypothetical protein
MNDERFLKDWLRDTTDDTPDPQASADRVLARVPETRQRSRWWPWLPGRHRPHDDTPPSPHGRTRLMLSPVKAITAGALALALSAAFLVAQPTDRDSAPGAEPAAEPPVRVEVTEALGLSGCEEPPDGRPADFVCEVLHEWSDPQLQGTSLTLENSSSIEVSDADGGVLEVFNDIYNIETEDGVWRMRPQLRFEFEGSPEIQEGPWWWVLDGDGAYEGMSLLLIRDRRDDGNEPLHGFVVPTDQLPPAPEGASTK